MIDLDLTTAEIVTLLDSKGWMVSSPIDGVFLQHKVRISVLHTLYSFVEIERLGPKDFKITPFRYKDKT
jgi:hypothetical protein